MSLLGSSMRNISSGGLNSPREGDIIDIDDFEMQNNEIDLEADILTYHDKMNKYLELENFICGLSEGTAFGELTMQNPKTSIYLSERNYSAICLTDHCLAVQILRSDFDKILEFKKKKAIDKKIEFIAHTEAFNERPKRW